MASVGDSFLALLGGAAEQGNKIIDEDRAARQRRIEQRQKALLESKIRTQETLYALDLKKHMKDKERAGRYQGIMNNVPMQQAALVSEYGFDADTASRIIKDRKMTEALIAPLTKAAGPEPILDLKLPEEDQGPSAAERMRMKFGLEGSTKRRMKPLVESQKKAAAVRTEEIASEAGRLQRLSDEERARQVGFLQSSTRTTERIEVGKKVYEFNVDKRGNRISTPVEIIDATPESKASKLPEPKTVTTSDGRVTQASWDGETRNWIELGTGRPLGEGTKVADKETTSQNAKEIQRMIELTAKQDKLLEEEQELSALINKHTRIITVSRTLDDGSVVQEVFRTDPLNSRKTIPVVTVETAGADMIGFTEKEVQDSTNFLSTNALDSDQYPEAVVEAVHNLDNKDRKQFIFALHRMSSRIIASGVTKDRGVALDMAFRQFEKNIINTSKLPLIDTSVDALTRSEFDMTKVLEDSVNVPVDKLVEETPEPIVEPMPTVSRGVVETTRQRPKSQQDVQARLEALKQERERRKQSSQ